ncbi:MAG: hypothetical protein NZM31_06110, partial [Gemmatales bacterium]|nr:hypothetical protein [Gemmatales bacterium]MDW8386572.1 hypothetical protein [Gemmatales bacterium]
HQILYGPTLKPYLFADLIGKTLVEKSPVPVQAVLCDCEELLELRRHVDVPVAWITAPMPDPRLLTEPQPQLLAEPQLVTEPQPRPITEPRLITEPRPRPITEPRPPGSGESTFRCHPRFPNDEPAIRQVLDHIEFASDLLEPFTRIREALSEARRAGAMNRAA